MLLLLFGLGDLVASTPYCSFIYLFILGMSEINCFFYTLSLQNSQDNNKAYAALFSPFWNEIIKSLREEDFISNRQVAAA